MDNIFVPYYIDEKLMLYLFRIVVEKYVNIESSTSKEEFSFTSTLPLSELTCGKILQGTATIQISKGFKSRTITEIETSIISVYLKLRDLLYSNNLIKSINNITELNNMAVGDLVELKCTLKENIDLKSINETLNLLKKEVLFESIGISNATTILSKDIDKNLLISFLNNEKNTIETSKIIKYVTEPLVNSSTIASIPLINDCTLLNPDTYIGKQLTIIGKVNCFDNISNYPSITTQNPLHLNIYEALNITDLISKATNNYEKIVEIIPVIIMV